MLFGGVTVFEGTATRPGQQFVTAIVGPHRVDPGGCRFAAVAELSTGWIGAVAWSLGVTNIVLGVFNLLPGLPLDGGQAMRAIVWKLTGRQTSGIRATAWIGRAVAVLLVLVTLVMSDFSGTWAINLAFVILVAWIMWQGQPRAALRSLEMGTP